MTILRGVCLETNDGFQFLVFSTQQKRKDLCMQIVLQKEQNRKPCPLDMVFYIE